MRTVKMVRMDKDFNNRKRKKTNDENTRNLKKFQWTRNGSGSEEEDEDLFSWEEYLQKCHAKAVPKETFKHVQDTKIQGFVPGMKLECLDRSSLDTDTYWVATVVMVSGPLLLLRYDGYDDDRSSDFWCDAASEELQPIGWSAKTNNILIPPSAIRHKESNWAKFLMQDLKDAVFAPEHLFHKRSDSGEENQLKAGLKLELLNKDDPGSYWVASVVDGYGLRLRLRYEGSEDETRDVWVYFLSEYVQQLGWGSKHNLTLNVPSGLKARHPDKDWAQLTENLLTLCQSSTEDVSLNESLHKTNCLPPPHGFKSGMKLEAVNPKDPSSICAATVSKVANATFFQVQIDSLISCGDGSRPSMWCNSKSRNIFPVGWCEKNSIQLTPPPGYLVHPFSWETYLEWTNSTAAPETLFTQEDPPHNFEIGMKLEAVDQTNPSTMTVATVTQVVGRTVWVLLDGYKHDSFEHIYDVESYNLYPVGWCSMNGHPLLTPRVQRPQEENRRLSSLRIRQRESKKTTLTSDTTNTSSAVSTTQATSTAKVTNAMSTTNLTETTRTASTCTATVMDKKDTTDTKNLTNTTSTSSSCRLSSGADVNMSDTHEVTKETTRSEGKKREERISDKETALKGPYDLRPSTLVPRDYVAQLETSEDDIGQEKNNVEAIIDLTGEEDDDTVKAAEPAPTQCPVSSKLSSKNDSGICIYVKKTCEPGPFLKQSRLAGLPPVIGPAGANIVLRQLVEQIVLSAHSSKQVLKLLASETDKMTIASILKTLRTKLSLCENLISLHRVSLCSQCDVTKPLPRSPSQHTTKNSALQNSSGFQQNREHTASCENIETATLLKTVVPVAGRTEKVASAVINRSSTKLPNTGVQQANSKSVACSDRASSRINNERVEHSSASAPPVSNEHQMDSNCGVPENNFRSERSREIPVGQVKRGPVEPSLTSSSQTTKHITQWNVGEVVDFIRRTDCHKFAEEFHKQEIDGRALTLLSLDEIHKCLGVTLGPAIKLHFSVQKLTKMHR